MAIKRYVANADTTITNAFEANLTTRGTGSNMGASDSLEVFSIYGQAVSGSDAAKTSELSRILVNFPAADIATDRTNSDIPASGSVSFYLRMFNAEHAFTVPKNYTLVASAITANWEEGDGLDMETYTDLTKGVTGSDWMNANANLAAATLVDAIDVSGVAQNDAFTMTVPESAGGDGVTYKFLFDSGTDVEANEEANTFGISLTSVSDDADCASVLVKAINGTADNKYKYGANNLGEGSSLAAGTIGLTAAIGSSTTKITLTMDDKGAAGNVANVLAPVVNFAEGSKLLITTFTAGDGKWKRPGGDYDLNFASSSFKQNFDNGIEDLEVEITPLVEQWINSAGNVFGDKSSARYGVGVFLTSSQEAIYTGSEENVGVLHNPTGSTFSYYTKKFFARGTEYFFKRPVIEARWDSSKKDNRENFYLSSSLASPSDNLMKLYLYNFVKGQLKNIPVVETGTILLSLYSGSSANTEPTSSGKLELSFGGGTTAIEVADLLTMAGPPSNNDRFKVNVPSSAGGTATDITFRLVTGTPSDGTANEVQVQVHGTTATTIDRVVNAINGADSSVIKYGAGSGDDTSGIAGITAAEGTDPTITITATNAGVVFEDVAGTMVAGGSVGTATVTTVAHQNTTASYVETGVYSASFALTGSSTLTKVFDVWHTGGAATHTQYRTGSGINIKSLNAEGYDPNPNYTVSMPNLRQNYSTSETARLRVSARKKDWSPTIYTKASNTVQFSVVEDAYYKIYRVKDDHTAIDFGTGSLNHTRLSYDTSGSYFNLNMSLLEKGYMYGIKYVFYENGKYTEQADTFKFRVE